MTVDAKNVVFQTFKLIHFLKCLCISNSSRCIHSGGNNGMFRFLNSDVNDLPRMRPHACCIFLIHHIQNSNAPITAPAQYFNSVLTEIDWRNRSLMFCFQIKIFKIQRPHANESIIASCCAKSFIDFDTVDCVVVELKHSFELAGEVVDHVQHAVLRSH